MSYPMLTFGGKNKRAKYTRKAKGVRKKGMEIESTDPDRAMAGGDYKQVALARHQGFVKPKLAKKLTAVDKWIKKRNLGQFKHKS